MTFPAYLRDLANKFRTKGTANHIETADRLDEIADELEAVQADIKRNHEQASQPIRDLSRGTNHAIERLRRAQQATPTPDELAEIRRLATSWGPTK